MYHKTPSTATPQERHFSPSRDPYPISPDALALSVCSREVGRRRVEYQDLFS